MLRRFGEVRKQTFITGPPRGIPCPRHRALALALRRSPRCHGTAQAEAVEAAEHLPAVTRNPLILFWKMKRLRNGILEGERGGRKRKAKRGCSSEPCSSSPLQREVKAQLQHPQTPNGLPAERDISAALKGTVGRDP